MKRIFDLLFAIFLLIFLSPILLMFYILIKVSSRGPSIHMSKRVGINNTIFLMPKFRSMYIDTPQVATHLLNETDKHISPVGKLMRKTSLDELPQLWSVFKGDMSFVGPRPALFNQHDLVALRTEKGVHKLIPGITGWAQVNGRDELPISVKVDFDAEYLLKRSLFFDIRILFLTLVKVLKKDGVTH